MIARRYETIVGIFVVASLAALLIMVVIVAQQEGLFQEYVTYRTTFKNVSGLKPGSEVHLAGVTVGNVSNTAINLDGNIVVTFQVFKKYSDRIRRDSRSTIGFMGLLGDKSLDLTSGSQSEPPIPPEGIVASVEPLDITQLLAKAAPSLEDLQKILTSLVSLTEGIAEPGSEFSQIVRSFKEIISKVERLADFPESGRIVPEFGIISLREIIYSPFRIVYRLDKDKVRIVRIWRSERLLKMPCS